MSEQTSPRKTDADPIETSCDICGEEEADEIPYARQYTGGKPIHICRGCGFVYFRKRRSAEAIADTWSDELYGAADGDEKGRGELDVGAMRAYSALTPYARARQTFVAEMLAQTIGLAGKSVVDVGAGQGQFLDMLRREHSVSAFGIEPSEANCQRMEALGIDHFAGIVEGFAPPSSQRFDIAAIMWTLENCESCRGMVRAARDLLKPDGHLVVATGSRILVPFKKPLHYFFNPHIPQDAHGFYFSHNCLMRLLTNNGFTVTNVNRYIDSDYLVMIGQKGDARPNEECRGDDPRQVLDFFRRWHEDTKYYLP